MNTTYENVWAEIEVCLSDMSPKSYDTTVHFQHFCSISRNIF